MQRDVVSLDPWVSESFFPSVLMWCRMRLTLLCVGIVLLLSCRSARAGQKNVVLFLDGARVEQEASASDGYLEYALPDSFTPGSLRVKPLGAASVLRVELVPAERDRRRSRRSHGRSLRHCHGSPSARRARPERGPGPFPAPGRVHRLCEAQRRVRPLGWPWCLPAPVPCRSGPYGPAHHV